MLNVRRIEGLTVSISAMLSLSSLHAYLSIYKAIFVEDLIALLLQTFPLFLKEFVFRLFDLIHGVAENLVLGLGFD